MCTVLLDHGTDFCRPKNLMVVIIDALDFIKYEQYPERLLSGNAGNHPSASVPGIETLLQLPHFTVSKVNLKQALSIGNSESDTCIAYTSIKGSFEIQTTPEVSPDSERLLTATEGETVLIPAETTSFILAPRSADATLLEVMVENLPADDDSLNPPRDGGEDLVGDGAEDIG